MKFSVSKDALASALSILAAVADKASSSLPILNCVLLRVDGQRLFLQATDLEQAYTTSIDVISDAAVEPGALCIPAKRLSSYIALLGEGPIQCSTDDAGRWIAIKSGKSRTRIAGEDIACWPDIPTVPADVDAVTISSELLAVSLKSVLFAVSTEESRFTLSGALLAPGADGGIDFVATDSHRLSMSHIAGVTIPRKILLPLNAIRRLLRVLPAEGDIVINIGKAHTFFDVGAGLLMTRELTGSFPDYGRVLPKGPWAAEFQIPVGAAKEAIKRTAQFADERSRAISIRANGTDIEFGSRMADMGESQESLGIGQEVTLEVGLNSSYILDILNVARTDKMTVRYKDKRSAVDFSSPDFRCIIMPMQMN